MHDNSALSRAIWPLVSNPPGFSRTLSDAEVSRMVGRAAQRHQTPLEDCKFLVEPFDLGKLIASRKSTRSFSEATVPKRALIQLIWAGYGIVPDGTVQNEFDRHTVPSAGALYPLQLSLALLKPANEILPGVYNIKLAGDGSIGVTGVSQKPASLSEAFLKPEIINNACGIIIISGNFSISEEKYGNRAVLYVPLEAGHAAQNMVLAAAELNIAAVEVGGFFEEIIAEKAHIPEGFMPLTTIVFGQP